MGKEKKIHPKTSTGMKKKENDKINTGAKKTLRPVTEN